MLLPPGPYTITIGDASWRCAVEEFSDELSEGTRCVVRILPATARPSGSFVSSFPKYPLLTACDLYGPEHVWRGLLVDERRDLKADTVTLVLDGGMMLLKGLPVVGRITYDESRNALIYVEGLPPIFGGTDDAKFSPMSSGRDCLDTEYGPVFAPVSDWNCYDNSRDNLLLNEDIEPLPPSGLVASRARYWRPQDVIRYLRLYALEDVSGVVVGHSLRDRRARLAAGSDILAWPDWLHERIATKKRIRRLDATGLSVHDALISAIASAGDRYALALRGHSPAMMEIADTRDETTAQTVVALDGSLRRSAEGRYSSLLCVGSRLVVESRVQTPNAPAQTGDPPAGPAGYTLDYGWTDDDETAFRTLAVAEGWIIARRTYPQVYAHYVLRSSCETLEYPAATYPHRHVPRPPYPMLASGVVEGVAGRIEGQEIILEFWDPVSSDWFVVPRSDGLIIRADGTIDLSTLMDSNIPPFVGQSSDPANIKRRRIRVTLARDHDCALTAMAATEHTSGLPPIYADVVPEGIEGEWSELLTMQRAIVPEHPYAEASRRNSAIITSTSHGEPTAVADGLVWSDRKQIISHVGEALSAPGARPRKEGMITCTMAAASTISAGTYLSAVEIGGNRIEIRSHVRRIARRPTAGAAEIEL